MSRWTRVARSMLSMGVTFAAIGGGFFAVVTAVVAIFGRLESSEPFFGIAAGTLWGLAIGITFSTSLAIAGQKQSFDSLSLPRVAATGAAGGLVLAGTLIGATTLVGDSFTGVIEAAIALHLLGAGAGTASLLVARRASPKLGVGDQSEAVKQ